MAIFSPSAIANGSVAAELGRSPSTVSREIRRNTSGAGNYRPFGAHRKAHARRPRPRSGKLAHDNDLRDFVVNCQIIWHLLTTLNGILFERTSDSTSCCRADCCWSRG